MSKKVIIGAVAAVLILGGAVAGIIALRGSNGSTGTKCGESEELKDGKCVAQKEVDIYAFERAITEKNKTVKLTVEVPKSLGYVRDESDNTRLELKNESDRSTLTFMVMLTGSIIRSENDFSKTAYKDFKKTENEDGTAEYEIFKVRTNGTLSAVEWGKRFEKIETYWSGVKMTATASGLDAGEDSSFQGKDYKTFDVKKVYDNEDFKYMLNSVKVEVSDTKKPKSETPKTETTTKDETEE